MTKENQHITVTEGQDLERTWEEVDEQDLSGVSNTYFAIARYFGGPVVADESDAGINTNAGSPTANDVTITISDSVTDNLDGDYVYELSIEDVAGNRAPIARGFFIVRPETTPYT